MKKTLKECYPEIAKQWDYEKNSCTPDEVAPYSNKSYWWKCPKCGYNFEARVANRTKLKRGCPCCANKVAVQGINDLATTHPKLSEEWHPIKNEELEPTQVTHGSGKKVWWICPEGHEYQATVLHRTRGTNCPVCNSGRQTSFAEQAIWYYVKKVYADAESRYKAPFLKRMELDIYIPSIKFAIEYDGVAWHKDNDKKREEEKYILCQKEGIRLLRIQEVATQHKIKTADDYLSLKGDMCDYRQLGILIRYLLSYLDPASNMFTRRNPRQFFSPVDVNVERDQYEIRKYMTTIKGKSLKDVHPDIAAEWHPKKNYTITPEKVYPGSDIKVWWVCPKCGNEYKSSISHRVMGTACPKCAIGKSADKRSKAVLMIDLETANVIEEFKSISEASRRMKISAGNIAEVCRGKRKNAGGYIWKYK